MDTNRIAMIKATLKYTNQQAFIEGIAPLISRAGLFIRTRSTRPIGTEVHFEFRLADDSQVYIGEGVVRKEIPFVGGPSSQMSGMLISLNRINRPFKEVVDAVLLNKGGLDQDAAYISERDATPQAMKAVPGAPAPAAPAPAKPKLMIVETRAGQAQGFDLFGETDLDQGLDDLFAGVGLTAPEISVTRSSGEHSALQGGFEVSGVYEAPKTDDAGSGRDYLTALQNTNEELRSELENYDSLDELEIPSAAAQSPEEAQDEPTQGTAEADKSAGEDETSASLLEEKRVSGELKGISLLALDEIEARAAGTTATLVGMVDASQGMQSVEQDEDKSDQNDSSLAGSGLFLDAEDGPNPETDAYTSQEMQEVMQQMELDEEQHEQSEAPQNDAKESIASLLSSIETGSKEDQEEPPATSGGLNLNLPSRDETDEQASLESLMASSTKDPEAPATDGPPPARRSFLDHVKIDESNLPKRQNVRSLGNIPVENPPPKKGGLFDKLFKK